MLPATMFLEYYGEGIERNVKVDICRMLWSQTALCCSLKQLEKPSEACHKYAIGIVFSCCPFLAGARLDRKSWRSFP